MTVEGLSHTYACIHSPPNPCPIQAATWHWADLPMLYNRMFLFCKWVHWYLFSDSKYKWCLIFIFLCLQFSPVAQLCLTLCDSMNHSTPALPVHHQLPKSTQSHDHRVGDAIQPSHPLSSPFLTYSLSIERLLLSCERLWDSWHPDERNSVRGQWRGLITQSFCVIQFY